MIIWFTLLFHSIRVLYIILILIVLLLWIIHSPLIHHPFTIPSPYKIHTNQPVPRHPADSPVMSVPVWWQPWRQGLDPTSWAMGMTPTQNCCLNQRKMWSKGSWTNEKCGFYTQKKTIAVFTPKIGGVLPNKKWWVWHGLTVWPTKLLVEPDNKKKSWDFWTTNTS